MFLRQQLNRAVATHWQRAVNYSTISTLGTVSKSHPINITTIPTQRTTQHIPQTQTRPLTESQATIDFEDPLVHLERARKLFSDEHGLFDKIDILSQQIKNPDTPIRVGLIGSKPTLLNTLLADPFASDQSWYNELVDRPPHENSVIRFSNAFEASNQEYNVPCPVLSPSGKNLEFVEINDVNGESDGCHVYISFQDTTPHSISKWPIYQVSDLTTPDVHDVVLSRDEISSQVSFQAVKLLTDSPKNATIYTDLYAKSNFAAFNAYLDRITEPNVVIEKLYNCVLKNLAEQNRTHSLTMDELNHRDAKIRKYIANWDQASHREFQTKFKPYVTQFERRELQWWKLYYRVDDVQEIFAQMLHQGLLNDSFKNYSYVKGQIDSFTSFQTDEVIEFEETLASLEQNELTTLKRMVIQNDLVELQNKAVKLLMTNFIGIQMPLLLVSIPGYIIYDFSMYSMAGLASLGAVIGFNNISKQWLKLVSQFKQDLFEKVRLGMLEVNKGLYDDWSAKYEQEKKQIMKRQDLIDALRNDLGLSEGQAT